jgi:hypothetical protein
MNKRKTPIIGEYEIRNCSKHGEVRYVKESSGYWRCTKCRNANVSNRRDKLKLMAIEYKGGECQKCGYNKCNRALAFHHLDPTQKDFGLAKSGLTRSWEKMKEELAAAKVRAEEAAAKEAERENLRVALEKEAEAT